MSVPTLTFTGQSTIKVNALCLAAANAFATPAVSSDVPVHETQALIDFFRLGAVDTGFGGVTLVVVAVVPGVEVVVVAAPPPVPVPVEAVLPAVTVDPLSPVVTTLPTVPVRTMVPTTVLEAPEDVVLAEPPAALELPLVDPQPAKGSATTREATTEARSNRRIPCARSENVMFK
jgi:hypothetical protein